MKTAKSRDPTEFHIGNSTFFAPPWAVLVYTTHLRKKKLPSPPVINGAIQSFPVILSH